MRLVSGTEGERSSLEQHADPLCRALRASVSDAVSEVRALSRSAYWAFQRHSKLLASFDNTTNRLVVEERHCYATRSPDCAPTPSAVLAHVYPRGTTNVSHGCEWSQNPTKHGRAAELVSSGCTPTMQWNAAACEVGVSDILSCDVARAVHTKDACASLVVDTTADESVNIASSVWSVRMQALSRLAARLRSGGGAEFAPGIALVRAISDPHHKVSQAAMDCMCALIFCCPRTAEPMLDQLLPELLLRVQDTRESTRAAAQITVQAVQKVYAHLQLIGILVRLMHFSSPRVRIGALALLTSCCLATPLYLSSLQHSRAILHKVLMQFRVKNFEVKGAALLNLRVLRDATGTHFEKQMLLLAHPNGSEPEMSCDGDSSTFHSWCDRNYFLKREQRQAESDKGAHDVHSLLVAAVSTRFLDGENIWIEDGVSLSSPEHSREQWASDKNKPDTATPKDWLVAMPAFLRQLANPAVTNSAIHLDALQNIKKATILFPEPDHALWSAHFEHALEAVLRSLLHVEPKIRVLAVTSCRDLLRTLPQSFHAFTEHTMLRLLVAGKDPVPAVAAGAEEALELLLSANDPHRCMAVLFPIISRETPPTLQLVVRLQARLVARFTRLELLSILPQMLPPLFDTFKHPNADVRKAVVFCLVDMYMILGEQLTPHLAVLSTSQLKLVTIYIDRVRVKR